MKQPPVGIRALRSGPALTVVTVLVIAALASSARAVPAPMLFLLLTVVYAGGLGGWRAGLASAGLALLYLLWLLTDAGRAVQYAPLDRTLLLVAGFALPLACLVGWSLHRYLQRERAIEWYHAATRAYARGERHTQEESERRFRMLVGQVRDYAIFMVDPAGLHTTWNEGVRRLLGYEEAEFLGQPAAALFTAEDRAAGVPERELETAARQGRASDDRWLVRKDGSRFWAAGITSRLNDDTGALAGFAKVFRDLTEEQEARERLRESEERLRLALQAARMGIWRWHLPRRTQRMEAGMARLLGIDRVESDLDFERFLELVHPDDRERVRAVFDRMARYDGELHEEFRIVWPDGTVRWLANHGETVCDDAGIPEWLTGAAVDITEQKLAEERLIRAQRMDAAGQIAGGVAHEINNMMTVVLGFSTLLLDGMRDDDARLADLRQIHRSAERAAAMTRQLLAFSRRQLLLPQVLDVNLLVRGLEHILRRLLGEDKVVRLDLAEELGTVRADPAQLEQVLLNLTLNARDAMPSGGTFVVTTRNVVFPGRGNQRDDELPPGEYVRLIVSDSGRGMDATTRARAFEPFFTTKPVGQGTGLGLATAFGIVRQSGGTIRLFSTPGEGTTFNIYLPRVTETPDPTRESAGRTVGRGSGTVLVVEDEPMVRSFTCRVLERHGYRCLEAGNGAEALEVVARRGDELAVVVTDVVMPVVGGGTLARRLAELRPTLPVLFTSAYSGDEVVRRGLIAADAPFLQKPFTPEALIERILALDPAGSD